MRCRHWPATQTLRSLKMFITTQESARWSWSNASVRYMCYFNQVDQGHGSEAQLLVAKGLAAGMEHMHNHFIPHQGLKPLNILVALEAMPLRPCFAHFGSCACLLPPQQNCPEKWHHCYGKTTRKPDNLQLLSSASAQQTPAPFLAP